MRFILSFVFTVVLAYLLGVFFDWWTVAIAPFLVALLWRQSPKRALGTGFLAIFLLWGAMALTKDIPNHHILSTRMGILILKTGAPALMILLSALLGGIIGGLSAWSGSLLARKK